MSLLRPIPSLYTVYVLRSTVRSHSLYIGSTPNPPRRLKQHNGEAKGGAARTARVQARPWDMVTLVSGFPGAVAALQFEWALNNPHKSLHIPRGSRISVTKRWGRNGRPLRPKANITSIVSNIHLLLRVSSFARWPLKLHFFAADIHDIWTKYCDTATEPHRATVPVFTDFSPRRTTARASSPTSPPSPRGIHALPLDYAPMKSYVEKTQSLHSKRINGGCVICAQNLAPGKGIYVTCSNAGCDATGHISCWSQHLLEGNAHEDVIPISGRCPSCDGEVMWGDMMKETSLRLRGQKEIEKLLKEPRKRKAPAAKTDS